MEKEGQKLVAKETLAQLGTESSRQKWIQDSLVAFELDPSFTDQHCETITFILLDHCLLSGL